MMTDDPESPSPESRRSKFGQLGRAVSLRLGKKEKQEECDIQTNEPQGTPIGIAPAEEEGKEEVTQTKPESNVGSVSPGLVAKEEKEKSSSKTLPYSLSTTSLFQPRPGSVRSPSTRIGKKESKEKRETLRERQRITHITLEAEEWYFGNITRGTVIVCVSGLFYNSLSFFLSLSTMLGEAEHILSRCLRNSFLIRPSTIKGTFACTTFHIDTKTFRHILIVPTEVCCSFSYSTSYSPFMCYQYWHLFLWFSMKIFRRVVRAV